MKYLILGRGKTGVSVFRYLTSRQHEAVIFDTRESSFFDDWEGIDQLVMSPGLDPSVPVVAELLVTAKERNIRVTSDIELFLEENSKAKGVPPAKVIGITGSNGKSTVCALVFEMLKASGKRVELGGNFGIPALDLVDSGAECYVLELSSFQLDLLSGPPCLAVATVLNVSPNHLDRHGTLEAYRRVKEKIYEGAIHSVTKTPEGWGGLFHEKKHEGQSWFFCDTVPLMPAASLKLLGDHNRENALAALAIVFFAELVLNKSFEFANVQDLLKPSLQVLQSFSGLPHRCRLVARIDEVGWINDSKSTTAASTQAALEGFGPGVLEQGGRLLLIAGGQAKGATFESLQAAVAKYVKVVIVFGQDQDQLKKDLSPVSSVYSVKNLTEAVMLAKTISTPNDSVLLSPGCASLDMFKNYEDRGEAFEREVTGLLNSLIKVMN